MMMLYAVAGAGVLLLCLCICVICIIRKKRAQQSKVGLELPPEQTDRKLVGDQEGGR